MKITINKTIIADPEYFIRRTGYALLHDARHPQKSFVRRFHRDFYPRFHIYIEDAGTDWCFNLHFDQRAPVYQGVTAHAGEYEGPIVENEARRIELMTNQPNHNPTNPITLYG